MSGAAPSSTTLAEWMASSDGARLIKFCTKEVTSIFSQEKLRDLITWSESVAYQGLNVSEMRARVLKALSSTGSTNQEVISKVEKLIVVGLCRGNDYNKIQQTVGSNVASEIMALIKVVGVERNIRHDRKAITLVRIATCFPELTAKVSHAISFQGPVAYDPAVPYIMRNSSFASLIPLEGSKEIPDSELVILIRAYKTMSAKFSLAIEPKKMKSSLTDDLIQQQSRYIEIARNSSTVSQSRRVTWITRPDYGVFINGRATNGVRMLAGLEALPGLNPPWVRDDPMGTAEDPSAGPSQDVNPEQNS